MTLLFSKKSRR